VRTPDGAEFRIQKPEFRVAGRNVATTDEHR
jgi:hypothetical protein